MEPAAASASAVIWEKDCKDLPAGWRAAIHVGEKRRYFVSPQGVVTWDHPLEHELEAERKRRKMGASSADDGREGEGEAEAAQQGEEEEDRQQPAVEVSQPTTTTTTTTTATAPAPAPSPESKYERLLRNILDSKMHPSMKFALRHPSIPDTTSQDGREFRRLQQLGECILHALSAVWVYQQFPMAGDAELAARKANLVSPDQLEGWSRRVGLVDSLAKGSFAWASKPNADAVAAVVGAIFQDEGFLEARECVLHIVEDVAEHMDATGNGSHLGGREAELSPDEVLISGNPKGQLQEALLRLSKGALVVYETAEESGPAHRKYFRVNCRVSNAFVSDGAGTSKKAAESDAARNALMAWAASKKGDEFWADVVVLDRKKERGRLFGL